MFKQQTVQKKDVLLSNLNLIIKNQRLFRHNIKEKN